MIIETKVGVGGKYIKCQCLTNARYRPPLFFYNIHVFDIRILLTKLE